jgi:hypothetical protein
MSGTLNIRRCSKVQSVVIFFYLSTEFPEPFSLYWVGLRAVPLVCRGFISVISSSCPTVQHCRWQIVRILRTTSMSTFDLKTSALSRTRPGLLRDGPHKEREHGPPSWAGKRWASASHEREVRSATADKARGPSPRLLRRNTPQEQRGCTSEYVREHGCKAVTLTAPRLLIHNGLFCTYQLKDCRTFLRRPYRGLPARVRCCAPDGG